MEPQLMPLTGAALGTADGRSAFAKGLREHKRSEERSSMYKMLNEPIPLWLVLFAVATALVSPILLRWLNHPRKTECLEHAVATRTERFDPSRHA
jgi:hypothetical protein